MTLSCLCYSAASGRVSWHETREW